MTDRIRHFHRAIRTGTRWGVIMLAAGLAQGVAAAESWKLNPARTSIRFEVPSSVWGTTRGSFGQFEGKLTLDFETPARSQVSFIVRADSMTTGSGGVDAYIKSDVLFDVERYPTMSFVSRKVDKLDEKTASVTGDLTLHGVTRPITLRVDVDRKPGQNAALFRAKGTVNRSAFGMDAGVPVVSDEVLLSVVAEAQAP